MNQNQIPFTVNIVTLNLFGASVTRQSVVMTGGQTCWLSEEIKLLNTCS